MRKLRVISTIVGLYFGICCSAYSQQMPVDSTTENIKIPSTTLHNISRKTERYASAINAKTLSALNKLEKLEKKYYRKLSKVDSLKAKELFKNGQQYYQNARDVLQSKIDLTKRKAGVYIPWLDSVSTTLKFLDKIKQTDEVKSISELNEIDKTLDNIKGLQEMLGKSKSITKLIDDRKNKLVQQFQDIGLLKEVRKFQTTVYYYKTQLAEYKNIINEPDQIFAKSIHLLQKIPAFNEFYTRNSILSQFFRTAPSNPNDPAYLQSLAGLQTRESVTQVMQEKLGLEKTQNANQKIDQLLQAGQSEIENLKSKLKSDLNQFSKDAEQIPNFRPQTTNTKKFLKRLEYGMNIQTQRATSFYPVGTDIGISIGYKINDKSIIGLGGSYSFSWGRDLKHIQITHKGVGIRSFIDWNMKWGLWLTGGYEMNYHSVIQQFSQLKELDAWQHSGLVGLSKNIPMKSRYLKFSKVQILWDLLSYRQIPRTQPILVRVGYGF